MSLTLKPKNESAPASRKQVEDLRLILAHGQLDAKEQLSQLQLGLGQLKQSQQQLLEVIVPFIKAQASAQGLISLPEKPRRLRLGARPRYNKARS